MVCGSRRPGGSDDSDGAAESRTGLSVELDQPVHERPQFVPDRFALSIRTVLLLRRVQQLMRPGAEKRYRVRRARFQGVANEDCRGQLAESPAQVRAEPGELFHRSVESVQTPSLDPIEPADATIRWLRPEDPSELRCPEQDERRQCDHRTDPDGPDHWSPTEVQEDGEQQPDAERGEHMGCDRGPWRAIPARIGRHDLRSRGDSAGSQAAQYGVRVSPGPERGVRWEPDVIEPGPLVETQQVVGRRRVDGMGRAQRRQKFRWCLLAPSGGIPRGRPLLHLFPAGDHIVGGFAWIERAVDVRGRDEQLDRCRPCLPAWSCGHG